MKTNTLVSALVGSSLCAAVAAWMRWQQGAASGAPDRLMMPAIRTLPGPSPDDSLAVATDALVANDPFRLSNSPPEVRYDPAADGAQTSTIAAAQPRPALVLKAIVGGPPWQAVIDGIPGQPPGTIVRTGSKFEHLTVHAVTRDSVVIRGIDTSWVLSFRAR
jgi:hypothetical protein